ncbi:unnamed protein product [Hermetia illucens]|uniref:Dehydrogenase/reductase SDR family member 7 n=1 Tax=Hermetia illucens TaxID=343691 RepID=A0A7R8V6T7_HERIL|nr:dehydrogenase/reductase SDR family member 7 [Hermetia illucens]CAD7093778.1 unnamed protein product [Hermetia illucens]
MGLFELVGVAVVLYFVVSLILWIICDCNIQLAFKEKFGHPVSALRGKVVWVTGASSGIGKDLALALAEHGVRLVLSARRQPELEDVKKKALERSNGLLAKDDILVLPMDMLNLEKHQQLFDEVIKHFGKLDILVNNAGRSQRAIWEEIDIQVDRDLFELDVFSVIHLSRIAVRYFKTTGGKGHLAVTSSGAGLVPIPFSPSYSGAKFALHGYFGSLKVEHPELDITVFCPGPIATSFLEEAFTNSPDKKHGIPISANDKRRMTSERCGELFAIALANKVLLTWCGLFPVNVLIYLSLYYPSIAILILKAMGSKGMKKIREGR